MLTSEAQIHATLALVAATAAGHSTYTNESNADTYIHGDEAWQVAR